MIICDNIRHEINVLVDQQNIYLKKNLKTTNCIKNFIDHKSCRSLHEWNREV